MWVLCTQASALPRLALEPRLLLSLCHLRPLNRLLAEGSTQRAVIGLESWKVAWVWCTLADRLMIALWSTSDWDGLLLLLRSDVDMLFNERTWPWHKGEVSKCSLMKNLNEFKLARAMWLDFAWCFMNGFIRKNGTVPIWIFYLVIKFWVDFFSVNVFQFHFS